MSKLIQRVKCLFGYHVYYPSYTTRQWRSVKGRHGYHEFQMRCVCCSKKTKWMKLKNHAKFIKSLGSRYSYSSY